MRRLATVGVLLFASTCLAAVTQGQAQQMCDDADAAIKIQIMRLAQEKASVSAYQSQVATIQTRYQALTAARKMDAIDVCVFLSSYQIPLSSAGTCCVNATDGLNGDNKPQGVVGAIPQLVYAKDNLAAKVWGQAYNDGNAALGWATYAQQQLDKAAGLHAAIDAGFAKADAVLTKNGG